MSPATGAVHLSRLRGRSDRIARCDPGGGSIHTNSVPRGDTPTPALPRKRERGRSILAAAIVPYGLADPSKITPPIRIAQPTTRHAVTRSPRISMPNMAPTIIDISRAGATRLSGAPISMADSTRM